MEQRPDDVAMIMARRRTANRIADVVCKTSKDLMDE
jgi:hypothetical protein